jgi:hypothetical protein
MNRPPERDELLLGKRLRTEPLETLTRPVMRGEVGDPGGHARTVAPRLWRLCVRCVTFGLTRRLARRPLRSIGPRKRGPRVVGPGAP